MIFLKTLFYVWATYTALFALFLLASYCFPEQIWGKGGTDLKNTIIAIGPLYPYLVLPLVLLTGIPFAVLVAFLFKV